MDEKMETSYETIAEKLKKDVYKRQHCGFCFFCSCRFPFARAYSCMGAGTGSDAQMCIRDRSFIYVDTGAMYRAVALYLLRNEIDGTDAEAVADNCQSAEVSIRYENGEQVVILNGENVRCV